MEIGVARGGGHQKEGSNASLSEECLSVQWMNGVLMDDELEFCLPCRKVFLYFFVFIIIFDF